MTHNYYHHYANGKTLVEVNIPESYMDGKPEPFPPERYTGALLGIDLVNHVLMIATTDKHYKYTLASMDDCTLLLSPLSSMTEEERKEYMRMGRGTSYWESIGTDAAWLTFNSFDIFNLLPQGLAKELTI